MDRHLALFAALLILANFGDRQCAAQARRPMKGGKAPETSIDRDFRPQQLAKLAVIASTNARDLESQSARQRLVEDIFVETLLDRGHVVVARSDIRSVLREQRLAESGLTDDHVVALGKLLNVPAVLVVRITEYALEANFDPRRNNRTQTARATVGVRLISVKTGAIWWQGTHSLSDTVKLRSEQLLVLAQVAERLARAFPEKPKLEGSHFDPEKIDKLALVMIGDSTYSSWDQQRVDQQRLVEDKLGIQLGKRGYALVSRSDLQALMVEKRFQQSGLTEENVSELGKLLNIPAVIVVRVTGHIARRRGPAARHKDIQDGQAGAPRNAPRRHPSRYPSSRLADKVRSAAPVGHAGAEAAHNNEASAAAREPLCRRPRFPRGPARANFPPHDRRDRAPAQASPI